MRSEAYMSQNNLQHGTTTDRGEQEEWKTRVKTDMLRSIGKGKFTPYAALRHALCCVIFATTHRTMPQYSGYYGHVAYVNTKRTTTRDVARHR